VQGEGRVVHHHRSENRSLRARVDPGEALATMDTEHLYLPPKVREMLRKNGGCTQGIELTRSPAAAEGGRAVADPHPAPAPDPATYSSPGRILAASMGSSSSV